MLLQVWNEPNLAYPPPLYGFWAGGMQDYFDLYNATAVGLLRAGRAHAAANGSSSSSSRSSSRSSSESSSAAAALAGRLGGPATSAGGWLREFAAFTHRHALPLAFVSSHAYPDPRDVGSLPQQLANMSAALRPLKQLPQLPQRPPQSPPRPVPGTPASTPASTALAPPPSPSPSPPPLVLSEYNSGLMGPLSHARFDNYDSAYSAAFVARVLPQLAATRAGTGAAGAAGAPDTLSWWAVSDVFEETGMDRTPFHNGYGLLTVDGVAKPVYRAFELLRGLPDGGAPLPPLPPPPSLSGAAAAAATAAADDSIAVAAYGAPPPSRGEVQLLVSTFDALRPGELDLNTSALALRRPLWDVSLAVRVPAAWCGDGGDGSGGGGGVLAAAEVTLIDAEHANPRRAWEEMGAPGALDAAQRAQLEAASEVVAAPLPLTCVPAGAPPAGAAWARVQLRLQAFSVALVRIRLAGE